MTRKLTDRQKDGRTEKQMDRPYFIGPFQPRPGVQKLDIGLQNILKSRDQVSDVIRCLHLCRCYPGKN